MSSQNATHDDSEVETNRTSPTWLKPELFEPLLRQTFDLFKGIRTFKVGAGTKPGDNYATVMLCINIEVELTDNTTEAVSYMLKIPHASETFDDMFGKTNIFSIERNMFTKYLLEFKDLYRKAGLELEFGAKCYELDVKQDYVLLENLRTRGFQTSNRLKGLDKEHTMGVLKKLAQWHAASAVRVAEIGPYPEDQLSGMFTEENRALAEKMTEGMLKYVLKSVETIEGHESYYNDIKNMKGQLYENAMQLGIADPNEFNVLNHGDCWTNNIMFQHDASGNILETYLVDYQMVKYGSVAQDLLYFLISSPQLELKVNEFDFFVKYYHDQLITHLKLLNYSKRLPSLIDIHTVLLKYGIWGYCTACGVMSGVLLESTDAAKFDNLFTDTPEAEEFKTLLFSGETYRRHIKVVMPWLQNRGALQINNAKSEKKSVSSTID
ncbi:uncharacterized protein LOC115624181 [Scaptodrosophila lebanonensis]|uniref:Uncharacterized protein LOC115624181 n=1 Tax=Drosophila lebanonensis TaxID=7225 RepID=A0A6J2THZ0_DROLE|nr:uncharacterized protein LOC115624181 [Scaptodrosophila lebanonensis]